MRPIKTVLLLQDLLAGGTQRHALELAKRLDPARFHTEIWTLMGGGDFLPKALEAGLIVKQLGLGRAVTPASLWGLWRELGRARPDALLALTVVPNIWGRVFGRLARVPAVVANCRGGDDLWRQHEAVLKGLAHHHICNAEKLKAALTSRYRVAPSRVDVIPTGVDTQYFTPRPIGRDQTELSSTPFPHAREPGSPGMAGKRSASPFPNTREPGPVIFCLARLAPIKDHETLVRAFEILAGRHQTARLVLAGDGELRDELASRIARSPARGRMELLPGTPDPRPLYAGADVVALSSANEGMPNVLLEAMAMGLPCVGTAVGGVPEVIRHGRTGLVVPRKDPAALAQALEVLAADEGLRERFGREGLRVAREEHSLESVAARHAAIIERLVALRRR
jgi:glycosyltransferase involved in cell wall biosynthesis